MIIIGQHSEISDLMEKCKTIQFSIEKYTYKTAVIKSHTCNYQCFIKGAMRNGEFHGTLSFHDF